MHTNETKVSGKLVNSALKLQKIPDGCGGSVRKEVVPHYRFFVRLTSFLKPVISEIFHTLSPSRTPVSTEDRLILQ